LGDMQTKIHPVQVVPITLLKKDSDNPNRMTNSQRTALSESFSEYGFIVPIITNEDFLIADGEQRLEVAKQLGMKEVSIIKLPIKDVDRRILRQVLNKLKGQHDPALDSLEFQKIIASGQEERLKSLLVISDDRLKKLLDAGREETGLPLEDKFEVIVECTSEEHAQKTFGELQEKGYRCRVLIF